jgi:hypothetical protein
MSHDHSDHSHHMHHHPVMNASTAVPITSTFAPAVHDHHDHSMHKMDDTSNNMGHAMHHMMEMAVSLIFIQGIFYSNQLISISFNF